MSEFINRDRRTFMANDVVTVAAAQLLTSSLAHAHGVRVWRAVAVSSIESTSRALHPSVGEFTAISIWLRENWRNCGQRTDTIV
jgi:hypothetical protein